MLKGVHTKLCSGSSVNEAVQLDMSDINRDMAQQCHHGISCVQL